MRSKKDIERAAFLEALTLWDRPEEQLFGKCLESDVDVDTFIDRALSVPRAGILRD